MGASANDRVRLLCFSPAANVAEIGPSGSEDPQVPSSSTRAATATSEIAETQRPDREKNPTATQGGGGPSNSVPRDTSGPTTNPTQRMTRGQEAAARANREMPAPGDMARSARGTRSGTKTLSQEELDEMNDDPDADMEQ